MKKDIIVLACAFIILPVISSCSNSKKDQGKETVNLTNQGLPDSENEYFIQSYPDEAFLKELETGVVDRSTADINPDELTEDQLKQFNQ